MVYSQLLAECPSFITGLIVIGAVLFTVGLSHQIPSISDKDKRLFQFLNGQLATFSRVFAYIWPLGTTPIAVVLIAMTFIVVFQVGITVTLGFTCLVIIERLVKRKIGRGRPFNALANVTIDQPTHPTDPSFPSGDAMRVSYLGIVIPIMFGLSWIPLGIACLGAAFICLSRIALGVHFPLDVLGGVGMGLIGAGFVLLFLNI
jgi:membrane-associated phospholipid phosphatase